MHRRLRTLLVCLAAAACVLVAGALGGPLLSAGAATSSQGAAGSAAGAGTTAAPDSDAAAPARGHDCPRGSGGPGSSDQAPSGASAAT